MGPIRRSLRVNSSAVELELEFLAASRLFRRSSALVASLSSRSATSLATFASCTMALCAATSFSSVADSSIHLRLSAGAASRIFRPRSTPPFAACTLVRMASRLAAPAWTHVLAQFVRPSCSSVPSQQSHTPSLTRDDGSDAGLCPRLRQWNSPFAHADVPVRGWWWWVGQSTWVSRAVRVLTFKDVYGGECGMVTHRVRRCRRRSRSSRRSRGRDRWTCRRRTRRRLGWRSVLRRRVPRRVGRVRAAGDRGSVEGPAVDGGDAQRRRRQDPQPRPRRPHKVDARSEMRMVGPDSDQAWCWQIGFHARGACCDVCDSYDA